MARMTIAKAEWAHELHVAPATTSPAQARDFVTDYCHRQDLSYLVDDVVLVVSELVTNAVIHAQTRIRVTIEELPFCVKLVVYDESLDLPVLSLAGRVRADDEGGRGLWLVDACSADWGTDVASSEGKSTWALFAVRPRSSWTGNPSLGHLPLHEGHV
jgi:anti-sigma regulatory factor (Ser/Thr protein kinase)